MMYLVSIPSSDVDEDKSEEDKPTGSMDLFDMG